MEPLISVIIPIYKVEKYLHQCVDSVVNQTYKNLEIILVDDGSPDNCGQICDDYAKKDRIKVIHKKNGGLSDARNAGLSTSVGKYLMFVDNDDLLPAESVSYLYKLITENDAQLAVGGRERFDDETNEILDTEFNGEENVLIYDKVEAMRYFLQNGCAAWARLYLRSVHSDIEFPINEINEDEAVVLQMLENCSRVVISNRIIYRYRCRSKSITTTDFSPKKLDWQKHCADNLDYIKQHHPELEFDAASRYRGSLLWSLTEIALSHEDYSPEIKKLITKLKENKKRFLKAPFEYRQDKIRLLVLIYLPFNLYKKLLRKKRKTGA